MKVWDVVVAGAGAAGLFFAARAARRGYSVLVLDPGPKTARKVRVSGGGRCNFTNLDLGPQRYLSANPHFTRSALSRFTPWDAVAWLGDHGLRYEEKAAGQLFCTEGAAAVARALEDDCTTSGVRVDIAQPVRAVEPQGDGFAVHTTSGTVPARRVAVATGGLSWPGVGASGLGYEIAKRFGLRVVPPRPALVPLICGNWPHAELAGLALPVRVSCADTTFAGDMLFTHKGLSGPAILQISSHWKRDQTLTIDLMPGQDALALLTAAKNAKGKGKAFVRNFLAAHLPARLAQQLPGPLADTPLAELTAFQLQTLAVNCNAWQAMPTRSEGWDKAEVTAGGVDTAYISSKTLAARNNPNLLFLGEVIDITGHLGGYNLHWAWASAHAAASEL